MKEDVIIRYEKLRIRAYELGVSVLPKNFTELLNDSTEEYLEKISTKLDKIEQKERNSTSK